MHDPLRNPLPVEVRDLVDIDEVLKLFKVRLSIFLLNVGEKVRTDLHEQGAPRADGEGVELVVDGTSLACGEDVALVLSSNQMGKLDVNIKCSFHT